MRDVSGREVHGPARAILPQPRMLGLRSPEGGAYRDPQPARAALPLPALPEDVQCNDGDDTLPGPQVGRPRGAGGDVAGARLPAPGDRRLSWPVRPSEAQAWHARVKSARDSRRLDELARTAN